ncbi:MAG: hypothetical protein IRY98_11435, partial [Alicyclobacillaceae bacterium]|nr:hypothetical protein [Alicyclobacillaceae bacterium]
MNKNRQQGGAALVLALLLVLLGAILSGGLLTMTISTNRAVVATENHTKAQYLAETAAKAGYRALQQDLDSFSQTPHSWTDLQ